jgi:hypothetical protein
MQTIDCRTGLGVLGRQGCLRCLASHPLGRVAVLVNGWPMIFPVNHHVVDSDTIVFRSDEVSKLAGVGGGLCMSLETDGIDEGKAGADLVLECLAVAFGVRVRAFPGDRRFTTA